MMIILLAEVPLLSIIIVENNWNFSTPVEFQRYKYAVDDISVIFSTLDIFVMLTIVWLCLYKKFIKAIDKIIIITLEFENLLIRR